MDGWIAPQYCLRSEASVTEQFAEISVSPDRFCAGSTGPMRTDTHTRTRLVDVSRLATDAAPLLAWYEWYADPDRRPLELHDVGELVDALEPLRPYSSIEGPVGAATAVLLAGGLGYSSSEHLDALDTLDHIASPDRSGPARWRENPRPNTFVALPSCGSDTSDPSGEPEQTVAQQLPGITWPEPTPRRHS